MHGFVQYVDVLHRGCGFLCLQPAPDPADNSIWVTLDVRCTEAKNYVAALNQCCVPLTIPSARPTSKVSHTIDFRDDPYVRPHAIDFNESHVCVNSFVDLRFRNACLSQNLKELPFQGASQSWISCSVQLDGPQQIGMPLAIRMSLSHRSEFG
jgi:hypothetical protein